MATTNLYKITVGDIELQSGDGTPDHVAATGSLYTNVPSSSLWINKGGSTWVELVQSVYGEMYFAEQSYVGTITAGNTWTTNTNIVWVEGDCNGFSVSASAALQLNTDQQPGFFEIRFGMSFDDNATGDPYDSGVCISPSTASLADNDPETNAYTSFACNTTGYQKGFASNLVMRNLNPGDKIHMKILNRTDGSDCTSEHGWVTVKRIGEVYV